MHAIVVISAFLNVATTSFFTIYYHVDVVTQKRDPNGMKYMARAYFLFLELHMLWTFFFFNSAGCDVFLLSCSLVLSSFFSFGAVWFRLCGYM